MFAAGDVANATHPFYGEPDPRRALGQRAAPGPRCRPQHARPRAPPTTGCPYFFSDQYDVGMEYTGYAPSWDRVVFRGDPASREFIAFWLRGRSRGGGHERQRLGRRPTPIGRLIATGACRRRAAARRPGRAARRRSPPRSRGGVGMNRLAGSLHDAGVSIWLDTLSRELLDSGDFAATGRASSRSPARPRTPRSSPRRSPAPTATTTSCAPRSPPACAIRSELFFELALEDVAPRRRPAASRLRRSGGRDGFVSFECTPDLADDTEATIAQALELWGRLDRPNVMIKVPATEAGVPAIEELTARGVNVNVTLLFSVARYEQVIDAYLRGLERRARGRRAGRRRSRRSRRSSSRASTPRPTPVLPADSDLRGRVAIANAQRAYGRYLDRFAGDALATRCAHAGAPTRSVRCGRAPAPRIPPTPTSSTSSS